MNNEDKAKLREKLEKRRDEVDRAIMYAKFAQEDKEQLTVHTLHKRKKINPYYALMILKESGYSLDTWNDTMRDMFYKKWDEWQEARYCVRILVINHYAFWCEFPHHAYAHHDLSKANNIPADLWVIFEREEDRDDFIRKIANNQNITEVVETHKFYYSEHKREDEQQNDNGL